MSIKKDKKFEIEQKTIRRFSLEFKKARVKELLEKRTTVYEISRYYEVSRTAIYNWLYLYSNTKKGTKIVVEMESEASKTAYYKSKLAELERLYGQKQLEVEYLNKGFEIASQELGFDIKKKYVPASLNISDKSEENAHSKTVTK